MSIHPLYTKSSKLFMGYGLSVFPSIDFFIELLEVKQVFGVGIHK